MSSIDVGIASNDATPGTFIQINFAQGQGLAGASDYGAILIGNMLSTGSASANTVYGPSTAVTLASELDAIALFGAGSELHRGYRRFVSVNNSSTVSALVVAESAGVKASGSITVVGAATANATIQVWVGDEKVDVSVLSGDAIATIATAIAAAVNTKVNWAVTATSAAGVVTVTAKQKGLRGNDIRISVKLSNAFGSTVTPLLPTKLTGGTTADDLTSALAVISGKRFYYYVPAASDATQLGLASAQVVSMATATTGIRQRFTAGSSDTLANTITLATGLNQARGEVVWQVDSDLTPFEIASQATAAYLALEQGNVPQVNFNGLGSTVRPDLWQVKAPRLGTAPTKAQVKSALNSGITPVQSLDNGSSCIVKRVTSMSLSGGVPDYRARDGHIPSILDRYSDEVGSLCSTRFAGKKIGDNRDPKLPITNSDVVTPNDLKSLIAQVARDFESRGLLERVEASIDSMIVAREAAPMSRLSAQIALDTTNPLDQVAVKVDQVG